MRRLDLVTQLNELEARREEYPETLAFINLLNSLASSSATGGGGGAAGALVAVAADVQPAVASIGGGSGGVGLSHFTGFVVQHVLAHLWHRGYRCEWRGNGHARTCSLILFVAAL